MLARGHGPAGPPDLISSTAHWSRWSRLAHMAIGLAARPVGRVARSGTRRSCITLSLCCGRICCGSNIYIIRTPASSINSDRAAEMDRRIANCSNWAAAGHDRMVPAIAFGGGAEAIRSWQQDIIRQWWTSDWWHLVLHTDMPTNRWRKKLFGTDTSPQCGIHVVLISHVQMHCHVYRLNTGKIYNTCMNPKS